MRYDEVYHEPMASEMSCNISYRRVKYYDFFSILDICAITMCMLNRARSKNRKCRQLFHTTSMGNRLF